MLKIKSLIYRLTGIYLVTDRDMVDIIHLLNSNPLFRDSLDQSLQISLWQAKHGFTRLSTLHMTGPLVPKDLFKKQFLYRRRPIRYLFPRIWLFLIGFYYNLKYEFTQKTNKD